MESSIYNVSAEKTATGAYLRVVVELKYQEGVEAPLWANGLLYAPHDTVLCPLSPVTDDQGIEAGLRGSDDHALPKDQRMTHLWLGASLGRIETDHIARLRGRDPKGDVHLTVKLEVRYLESAATVTHLQKAGPPGRPARPRGSEIVMLQRRTMDSQPILGEGGNGYVLVRTHRASRQHRIPSNDWTHDFAPKFGLGRFCVFELPQPEVVGTGSVQERARQALESALKAEDELRAGRWTDACEDLRKVWELIRDDADLEALLMRSGYTQDAAQAFNQAVKRLFDFSSKFMHSTDKGGKPTGAPQIRAEREDAYLVFATAMSIVNLIAQKAR